MGALWEDLAQRNSYATLLHTALHICNLIAYYSPKSEREGSWDVAGGFSIWCQEC